MKKFGDFVCRHKWLIVIFTLILMIPMIIGYFLTDINYDILVYLPSDIETLKGEHILTDDFNMGAFSIVVAEDMSSNEVLKLEDRFREIDSVENVVSINDLIGTNIPLSVIPNDIRTKVSSNNSTLILVTFLKSTSDDLTLKAVEEMRNITSSNVKIGGMSAMVLDTKKLFNSEMLLYIVIAVILCIIVLEISLDSFIVPILLMGNIGIAILFNMGSNIFLGNISYITKAIAAVLQLGVTTDFSIFLYHKYERLKNIKKSKEEAMSDAIYDTFTSVFGSSLTTIAGFLALCTMNLTLGWDIGIVMAKGVLLGVVCVLTLFPALLLVFDKWIEKTKHKVLLPKFNKVGDFVIKHYKVIFIVFLILFIPAYLSQSKTEVYYKLDESIPDNYGYSVASKKLKEDYKMVSQEMILIDKNMKDYDINKMIDDIKKVEGIDLVISPSYLLEYGITDDMVPDNLKKVYETDKYKMIVVASSYDIATDELNNQIDSVKTIIKKYDKNSILAGEGPLMKDLVKTTDQDFKSVNYTSIIVIFIIMMFVLKSISLPVLLVAAIEFAIFINMGIPYFTDTKLPFISSVVIGTIQLGATIDYAILMTTKYLEERKKGKDKVKAIRESLDSSISSIVVSAMCFFAATIGVGLISKIDMIGSLCTLMARGAIISMLVVVLIVPSILLIFDKLIIKTTYLRKGKENMKNKKLKKTLAVLLLALFLIPLNTKALTKEETVFASLESSGKVKNVIVNEHLINKEKQNILEDLTDLENIENINSDAKFKLDSNRLSFESNKEDIVFRGTTSKMLPVELNITYKLNGKEIKLDNLLGKSGKVEINIKYINKVKNKVLIRGKERILYTPFVVGSMMHIPSGNNTDVIVTNGKVIDNGTSFVVVGLSSPGLYESLNMDELKELDNVTITYNTKKFELSSIYTIITPKILDSSVIRKLNKLDSIYSSVNKLQDSINKISDGSNQIKDNLVIITDKLNEIKNGTIKIDSGLKQILSELSKVKTKLNGADNTSKLSSINTLINTNITTINKLKEANTLAISAYNTYHLDSMDYSTISNLAYDDNTKASLISAKNTYENMLESNLGMIKLLESNNYALNESLESFKTTSEGINNLITTLNKYLTELEKGTVSLSNGSKKLTEGAKLLTSKMIELNSGIDTFNKQGITKISAISNRLNEKSSEIKELINLSNKYESFSIKKDSTKSNTKFIMVVDGKKAEVEKKEVKKEIKKKSLWDKIIGLFK